MLRISLSVSRSTLDRAVYNAKTVIAMPHQLPPNWSKYNASGWIIMVAPRPLRGTEEAQGENIHGRHWTAIRPTDKQAIAMLEQNLKLDARVVFVLSKEDITLAALVGNKYRDKYKDMDVDRRYKMLTGPINKLQHLPHHALMDVLEYVR